MENPKIRFKGFTKDWEQRKLGEIYGSIGNAFVGTATPYYAEHGHFYLESNNVKDGQINHNAEIFINDEFYEKQKDKWLHTGDMVMVQSGHVGHAAVIPEELDNTAAHALIMFRNPKEEIEPYFLNYEYQTDKAKKQIENITTGNTIKHILASDMQEFVVDIPKYEEQKVIASYFCKLDHLITLHQRKCEQTKKLKKYMLQKMFPRNGAKVPEIRFDGFTYDWEQRKLGELVKEGILEAPLDGNHGEKHPTSDEYVDSGIPFLMASDIHNGEVNIYSCKYITKERAERLDKGFARNGDVLLTHKATIGETAILSNLMTEYAMLTPQVTYYRIKNEERLNREYLYSFFNSLDFQTELKTKAAQSTRPYIGITAQQNLKIILPAEIDEQIRIGLYFRNLDHLITLHQRKCDELKKMKKYMLQNMFI